MFERKRKSTTSPSRGIEADQPCRTPTLPAIRARWNFDMPRLRASQISQAPIAAVTTSPSTGTRPTIASRPTAPVRARHGEGALEQRFHRLDPPPHRGGVAADRQLVRRALEFFAVDRHVRTSSAIRFARRMAGERVGPEAGQPRRDQRPAHRRAQWDERREAGQDLVGDGELRLPFGRSGRDPRRQQRLVRRGVADPRRVAGEMAQIPGGEHGRRDLVDQPAAPPAGLGGDPHRVDADQPPVAPQMGEQQAVAGAVRHRDPHPERRRARAAIACAAAWRRIGIGDSGPVGQGRPGKLAGDRRARGWCAAASPARRARRRARRGRSPCSRRGAPRDRRAAPR